MNYREASETYDVIVAGGGPSGVAAAIGAARQGKRTLLIEKNGYCGGMASISGAICGLYTSAKSGNLTQLVHGFAGEFYDEMKKRGGVADPYPFGDTSIVVHDHLVWREAADDLLEQAAVEILFHTEVTGVEREGARLSSILISNKEGTARLRAERYVDATGDGDVCALSGVPYTYGKNGEIQYATMMFRIGNVDVGQAKSHTAGQLEAWINEAEAQGYRLPRKHIYVLPSPRPNEILCNMTAVYNEDGTPIDAVNAEEMTKGERNGRKQVREYERFLRNFVPGFEHCVLVDVGNELGIRQSRTIRCRQTLTNEDVLSARKFEHAVAKSAWCIEAHGIDGIFMHYFDNEYYEIPYEVMLPEGMDNLITCSRSMSIEHEALASARVTAQCFLTGYAAGAAAAVSIKEGCAFGDINFELLRKIINY